MKIMVVAPHPDDESLGCGGTLLRLQRERRIDELHWVIVTEMKAELGFAPQATQKRDAEIDAVARTLGVTGCHRLGFATTTLEGATGRVIERLAPLIGQLRPDTVLAPFRYDIHTDHRVVFDAVAACTKAFRYPFVKRFLVYETLSETDFAIDPGVASFRPNLWVDISNDLDAKLQLLNIYGSEMGAFPFPRSAEAVVAQARIRGVCAGVVAAEAFMLLKGII